MATFYDDWSGHTAGIAPSGYTIVGSGIGAATVQDAGLPSGVLGPQALRITASLANSFYNWSGLISASALSDGATEVLTRWLLPTAVTSSHLYRTFGGVSYYGTSTAHGAGTLTWGGAGIDFYSPSTTFQTQYCGFAYGTGGAYVTTTSGYEAEPVPDVWMWSRYRFDPAAGSYGTGYHKMWADGTDEPEDWELVGALPSDKGLDADGGTGLFWMFWNDNNAAVDGFWCDWFSVGTAGDAAPEPPLLQVIELPHLSNPTIVNAPTLTAGTATISLPHLGPVASAYAPTLTPGTATITLPHLSNPATAFAPTLTGGVATISLPHIDNPAVAYAPTLAPGTATIILPYLDNPAVAYTPSLVRVIGLPHLDNPAMAYAPTLTPGPVTITLPHLSNPATTYAPTMTAGVAVIGLPHIANPIVLFAPTLTPGTVTITLPFIDNPVILYAPTFPAPPIVQIYTSTGPPVVWLQVFGPLPAKEPIGRIDLNVRQQSVTFGTGPGGWADLTAGNLRRERDGSGDRHAYHLDTEVLIPRWAHLELWVNGQYTADFQAMRVSAPFGRVLAVSGQGYGITATRDDFYDDPPTGAGALVNDSVLLRQLLRERAPLITAAGGTDWTAVTTTRDPAEWQDMTLYDALEQVAAATGVRWAVWHNRELHIMPATVSGQPKYHVPFTEETQWDLDWMELATDAVLTAIDGSGKEARIPIPGSLSPSDLGGRRKRIPLRSDAGLQAAEQWARQHMIERGQDKVDASITLIDYEPLTLHGGGAQQQWDVLYGEPLAVGNQSARLIEGTTNDLWRGTLAIRLGQPASGSLGGVLRRTVETASKVREGRDPLTGGRRRR